MQRIVGRSRPRRCGGGFGRAAAACGGWQPLNPSARSHMPLQRRQFPREFGSGVHQGDGGVIGKFGTSELLPHGVTRHLDFFGESVTFSRDASASTTTDVSDAVASLDNMMMCIISRGSANIHNGHDGEGPEARANHSSAMAWSDLLRHAGAWESREGSTLDGRSNTSAPMLAVAAVAPCLAQGGVNYVRRIDRLLSVSVERGPCLLKLAHEAASLRDAVASVSKDTLQETYIYSQRERLHLHALHHLLQNKHRIALGSYLRILELCPGDLFALSLAIDVANAIGDSSAAMRAATNVSAYWAERDSGAINYAHPAVNLAAALVSVGLSSRASTAERLAETSLARDPDGSGGVAIWALVHCWGSEGRSSEMISKLTAFDGAKCYETCGYLNFHARMKAYGGISLLDRMGAGADRSAVRLYDGGMGQLLAYTGNSVEGLERGGEEVCLREKRLPKSVRREIVGSMFSGLFGRGEAKNEDQVTAESDSQKPKLIRRRTIEDILCWLPPSPLDLSIATAFLLRLTLSESISEQDERWYDLRAAWQMALEQNESAEEVSIDFMPGAMLAASLLIHPDNLQSNVNCVSPQLESAMIGLHRMGQLMMLGRTLREAGVVIVDRAEQWKDILKYLARASDCLRWEIGGELATPTYHIPTKEATSKIAWDFDLRQFLEYSVCHAALQVGDYESLCLARSLCSEGVTLRANCPEIWYRYSNVLEMLGDEVGAENARSASVSLGYGEGASAVSL